MILISIIVSAACTSFILTAFVRRYALSRRLIDVPNERSSHLVDTPRGGGLAVAITFLVFLPILSKLAWVQPNWLVAASCGGTCIALLGFADDHFDVRPAWRLIGHFLVVIWSLFVFEGIPRIEILGSAIPILVGVVLVATAMVWLVNLYNFMDGIDAIASIEAITVCAGGVLLYLLADADISFWAPTLLLLAAVSGFLYWNLPTARIFLGDAGSGFLGFIFATLVLQAAWFGQSMFWAWCILLAIFVCDATVALCRRCIRGLSLHKPHRSHGYQYLSRRLGRHLPVALAVGAINLFWLTPLAVLVVSRHLNGFSGFVIAYGSLVGLTVWLKSGAAELQDA